LRPRPDFDNLAPMPDTKRIQSLDIARGIIMVLMAIDHVRVYSGVPPGGPTFGVFFTRWVTNFSAPGFVFLAGTGAFLYGKRHGSTGTLARFLAIRGVWLIFLELTVLRLAWTFNVDWPHYMLAGVIWMLGWCMLLLSVLVWLPVGVTAVIGLAMIAGHDLLDPLVPAIRPELAHDALGWLWKILYFGGGIAGTPLIVLYSLVPWIGVMAAGYAFGTVMTLEPARRDRLCHQIGGAAIAAFLLLRGFDLYGDPRPWAQVAADSGGPAPPALLRFLNTNKYPASLLFLLMTLGPIIVALPWLERARGAAMRALDVFGRVPLFFYLLHIPLIHALALIVSFVREGTVNAWLFTNHPMASPWPPDGYPWSLPLLYLVWVIAIVLLYLPCRWYANYKATHREAWLSYL
jgi:uncharacterized membrane protein